MQNSDGKTAIRQGWNLPKLFVIAIIVHAVAILGPDLLKASDEARTPEEMIQRARIMANDERYEAAFAMYRQALTQKPEIPPIWIEAEREMEMVKRKHEEAMRERAQASLRLKSGEEGDEAEKEKPDDKTAVGDAPTAEPTRTPTTPVTGPDLPGIGEDW